MAAWWPPADRQLRCLFCCVFADEFCFNPQFDLEPEYIIRKPLLPRIQRYMLRREILSTFHTRVDNRSIHYFCIALFTVRLWKLFMSNMCICSAVAIYYCSFLHVTYRLGSLLLLLLLLFFIWTSVVWNKDIWLIDWLIVRPFVWDYPREPVPEETFTHSHLSWSSIIFYLLPPSIAIHSLLPEQFTCLRVFLHNLCPSILWSTLGLAPSTLYAVHFFTQSLSSFCTTCPYHRDLFCCSTKIISSNPSLSILYLELYLLV